MFYILPHSGVEETPRTYEILVHPHTHGLKAALFRDAFQTSSPTPC